MKQYLKAIFRPNKKMKELSIIKRIKVVKIYNQLLKMQSELITRK